MIMALKQDKGNLNLYEDVELRSIYGYGLETR